MSVLLGLDVGDVRIGVAISDVIGSGAHPLCTLTRTNRQRDITAIGDLVSIHNVERIVLGLPLSHDGSIGNRAKEIQTFGNRLAKALDIPVEFQDERFTTADAEAILERAEVPLKDRKKKIDQVSAVIILNEYINSESQSS